MITIPMRKARIIANMTEKEACAAMHITEEKLSAWENGKSVPTWKYVWAMVEAYQIPVDLINFQKEYNQPEIARKLTLEEIKALPKATVIWFALEQTGDTGVIWHSVYPCVVCASGENGMIIGGNKEEIFCRDITDTMLDESDISFWDHEPNDIQLIGINEKEYNSFDFHEEDIIFPALAAAITSRRISFKRFCDMAELDKKQFAKAITGQREFAAWDIEKISQVLNLTDSETDELFSSGKIIDITTGRRRCE